MTGPIQRSNGINFPSQNLNVNIRLQNGNNINLEGDDFDGNAQKAIKYLQDFCADPDNTIDISSKGRGYGILTVNGVDHNYTPYGIDLKMMLEFCGGKTAKDFK